MIFLRGLPLWREALRGLGAIICNWIYSLISLMFQVFVTVAQANIFDENTLGPIYQRVTLILTIVMTFYITFEFVKYIIQPDTMGDKDKGVGNIAVKIVIVIALIAMVPKIFSLAYNLQGRIINQNVIGKVILGSTDQDYNKIGYEFSSDMLGEFYKIGECRNSSSKCQSTGKEYDKNIEKIKTTGVVNILPGINDSENEDQGVILDNETPAIDFNGFMAIIVGGLILYILVLYSIDLGVRYAQLLYLQVIAPIAIMGYLLPKKDGIFQKWTKQCFTTYLDVFIRLSVIYFVLLLIDMIGNNKTSIFAGIPGTNGAIETFAYIAIVLGLLLFAQRAPKLLQELFPSSGAAGIGMGLGAKSRFEPMAKGLKNAYKGLSTTANAGARVTSGVGGAIAGFAAGKGFRGRLRTGFTGAKEGAKKDNKGLPHRRIERAMEAAKQRKNREDDIARNAAEGVNREQAIHNAIYHKERYAREAAEQDRKLKLFDVPKGSLDSLNAQIDEFKQVKAIKAELKSAESRGASAAEIKTIDAKYKATCQAIREAITVNNGVITDDMMKNGIKGIKYNKTDENGFPAYEYVEERDANGAIVIGDDGKPKMVVKTNEKGEPVLADKLSLDLRFDEGDKNYAGAINKISAVELAKIKQAASEVPEIGTAEVTLKVGGKEITASISDWVNDKVVDPNNPNQNVDSRIIYAEFANKFKDAMVTPKTEYQNSPAFVNAHAFKDGIGDSGSKK